MPLLGNVFATIAASRESRQPLPKAAQIAYKVGRDLHIDAFEGILAAQVPANLWERRFQLAIERDVSYVRAKAIGKLAASPEFVEQHARTIADKLGDALRMVRQSASHGLVPLFLILEDYRAMLA